MIPKVIHYCWFGGNPIPKKDIRCIESWKKYCPDYEIKEWNESNYDIHKNKYMEQAYEAKKWGFVSDFARLDIIFEHGGIYLDTDVEIIKNLDDLLSLEGFMGFENTIYVNPGNVVAGVKGQSIIGELMKVYEGRQVLKSDGTPDLTASPSINTEWLVNLGLVQNGQLQVVDGLTVFPADYFCPKDNVTGEIKITGNTSSVHHFNASWMTPWLQFKIRLKTILGPNITTMVIKIKRLFKRR